MVLESITPLAATVPAAGGTILGPLQLAGQVSEPVRIALQAYEFVGVLLGVFIAYQAYRGYRRNDSRPMLFIAAGFVCIAGVPALFALPILSFGSLQAQILFQAFVQTTEILGLGAIIYALRMDP